MSTRPPDMEWLSFEWGLKPGLRLTIDPARADELAARLQSKGFPIRRAEREVTLGGRPQIVLYAARSEADAEALRQAEAPILPGGPPRAPDAQVLEAHRELGRRLGFAPCCVDAFLQRLARGVTRRAGGTEAHEDFVAAEDAALRSTHFYGRLNNLRWREGARLLSFYPCRYDCPEALRLAGAFHLHLQRKMPLEARALAEALTRPVTLAPTGERIDGPPPPGSLPLPFDRY